MALINEKVQLLPDTLSQIIDGFRKQYPGAKPNQLNDAARIEVGLIVASEVTPKHLQHETWRRNRDEAEQLRDDILLGVTP